MYWSLSKISRKGFRIYELISTSWHESGHVIYALLHLMKVKSVSVFESKKLKRVQGITSYDHLMDLSLIQDSNLLTNLVRADVGMSYAGLIAEKSLYKNISGSQQTPLFISEGSSEDNRSAHAYIKKYNLAEPGSKRASFKNKLIREVQKELFNYWDDVALVAHSLFKDKKLLFEDLQNLLSTKSNNKKFWKEQFKKINLIHNNDNMDEEILKSIL